MMLNIAFKSLQMFNKHCQKITVLVFTLK